MSKTTAAIQCPTCSAIITLPAPGYGAAVCAECENGALLEWPTGWIAIPPPAGFRMLPTTRKERVLPGDIYFDFDISDGPTFAGEWDMAYPIHEEMITTWDFPLIARPLVPEIGAHEQNGPEQLRLW